MLRGCAFDVGGVGVCDSAQIVFWGVTYFNCLGSGFGVSGLGWWVLFIVLGLCVCLNCCLRDFFILVVLLRVLFS